MHLGERGGGERLGVDVREYLGERPSELALDVRPERVPRTRRHAIVEPSEPPDEGRGQHVGARTRYLTDLDEQPGQLDAQVMQRRRRPVVCPLPIRRRRLVPEPLAEAQPLVPPECRPHRPSDPENSIDGVRREHTCPLRLPYQYPSLEERFTFPRPETSSRVGADNETGPGGNSQRVAAAGEAGAACVPEAAKVPTATCPRRDLGGRRSCSGTPPPA